MHIKNQNHRIVSADFWIFVLPKYFAVFFSVKSKPILAALQSKRNPFGSHFLASLILYLLIGTHTLHFFPLFLFLLINSFSFLTLFSHFLP